MPDSDSYLVPVSTIVSLYIYVAGLGRAIGNMPFYSIDIKRNIISAGGPTYYIDEYVVNIGEIITIVIELY